MAITKIFTVKERIDHLIDYIVNPDKTSDCKYVSGTNCSVDTAAEMMRASYTLNDKPLRVEGYHIIQSFAKGETDAKTAHSIGVAFAERLWGGRFQVVVTTHINTDVCHNHIALCSTSFVDGKRYHSCKDAYQLLRDTSDALCREYGLSIIEKPEDRKYKSFAEVKAEREGKPTWRSLIKEDVDEAIERATSTHGFLQNLRNIGYEIKMGSDVSVRPPGKERFVRLEHNLGSDYSIEAIKRQLLSKVSPTLPIPKPRAKDARPDKLPPVLKGSIVALYRHYLYLFGYYKSHPIGGHDNSRMPYQLREELRKSSEIAEDERLINKEGIETLADLNAFRESTKEQVDHWVKERRPLYRIAKDENDPIKAEKAQEAITDINTLLKTYRKSLRQCDRIEKRSKELWDKYKIIEDGIEHPSQKQNARKQRER